MKLLRCRDVGFLCDFEVRAPTVALVIELVQAHAWQQHGIPMTPDIQRQIEAQIRDEHPGREPHTTGDGA